MKMVNRFKWFQPYDVQISIENHSDVKALEELERILSDKKIQKRFNYSGSLKILQELTTILLLKTEKAEE